MSASKQDYDEKSPPVYSSTADSAPLSTSSTHFELNSSLSTHQQLAFIDFTRYKIGSSTISEDHVTVLTRDERFSRDPHALLQLIHEQAQLPPKLHLRIRGSHSVYGEVKSDFDLTLNLMPLLCSETERWSYLKIDGGGVSPNGEHLPPVPGTASSDLEKLAIQYCDDPNPIKR